MAQRPQPKKVLQVGRVRIGDHVAVDAALPAPVEVPAGQPVVLEVPYHLHETSDDKESYLFSLQCNVGALASPASPQYRKPVIDQWEDHWGRRDDRTGALRDEIVLAGKGDYAVEFTIEAAYTRAQWGQGRVAERRTGRAAGTVHLRVV